MEEIKVSVIVPVYNAEEHLRECVDSIVGQSLKEIEIIFVDDGSEDSSVDILKEYAEKDPRITILFQEHGFAGTARNKGKAIARGKYLVFWDSDDYFKEDALKLMYEQSEKDEADICICGGRNYFEDEGFEAPAPRYMRKANMPKEIPFNIHTEPDNILMVTVITTWNKMFLRSFVEREKIDFAPVKNENDVYFVATALCLAEKITLINKELVVYRKSKQFGLVANVSKEFHNVVLTWIDIADNLKRLNRFPERSFANKALEEFIDLLSKVEDKEIFKTEFNYFQKEGLERLSIKRSDDEKYYFIKWHNEASRKLYDCSDEEFDRWLCKTYFGMYSSAGAKSRKDNEKYKQDKDRLNAELKKKNTALDDNKKKLEELKKKNAALEKKYDATINSTSFKVGRVITWIPRKIRDLFKH